MASYDPYELSTIEWYNPADPRSQYINIDSGLKKLHFSSCQYFVKNLPKICQYWANGDPGHCSYGEAKGETGNPTGYNGGKCDFLGRNSSCSRYSFLTDDSDDGSEDDSDDGSEEWVCCAPNPYLSGLVKRVGPVNDADYRVRAIAKSEIAGYNESDSGVGQCDGWGCGRGKVYDDLADVFEKPVVCKYYKPWSMGFGAVQPQTYEQAIKEYSEIYEDSYKQFLRSSRLDTRLPYSFLIYNMRAFYQRCQYWQSVLPGSFSYNAGGLSPDHIDISVNPADVCACTDTEVLPYKTLSNELEDDSLLKNVWCEAGTVVCNGAKPECPGYTGQWLYCTDEKMQSGMRITPFQIFELRFWTRDWESQTEYEEYFEDRPNWQDVTTADIYTFNKWKTGEDITESHMFGKKFHMEVMIDQTSKKFDVEELIDPYTTEVEYARYGIDTGTTTAEQKYYPTLIRRLWELPSIPELGVIYPTPDNCTRKSNQISGDKIAVVGYTYPNITVYAVNTTEIGMPVYCKEHDSPHTIPDHLLEDFYNTMDDYRTTVLEQHMDKLVYGSSDASGVFTLHPLDISYAVENSILVMVRLNVGTWAFLKRGVTSTLCGGFIQQTSFDFKADIDNYLPGRFSPPASISFRTQGLGGSVSSEVIPLASYNLPSLLYDFYSKYYSYSIDVETKENVVISNWYRIGITNYIFAIIDDIDLNYIFKWKFVSGTLTIKSGKEPAEGEEAPKPTVVDLQVLFPPLGDTMDDFAHGIDSVGVLLDPNMVIFCPKPDDTGKIPTFHLFDEDKITIKISYKTYYMRQGKGTREDGVTSSGTTVFPGKSSPSLHYIDAPFAIGQAEGEDGYSVVATSETLPIMAFFREAPKEEGGKGRIVAAVATKLYTNVNRIYCRNIEIFYKYSGNAIVYLLKPSTGFIIEETRAGPEATGATTMHEEIPPCGDHELDGYGRGPMWYPFNRCAEYKFYHTMADGASCTSSYKGEDGGKWGWYGGITYRSDYRFCGTHKYNAWVEPGGNWLSACGINFQYYFSKVTKDHFTGYGNIVSAVDEYRYKEVKRWPLPPFGNWGREVTERYFSKDSIHYRRALQNTSVEYYELTHEWLPTVIDNTTFYMSFNCFDTPSETDIKDCFSYLDQMNFWKSDAVMENTPDSEDPVRISWENLFAVDGGVGIYPRPVVYFEGSLTPHAYWYYFKLEDVTWAWQEYWKDIERGLRDEDSNPEVAPDFLHFVLLERPDYVYDIYKTESRFICLEGFHTITFTPPEFSEGILTKYPSVDIDGAYPRYFEIMYDQYDDTYVDWADEGRGDVGGSGGGADGDDGKNIYEKTSFSSLWYTRRLANVVYSSEASMYISKADSAGRFMYLNYMFPKDKTYYNRGLLFNIYKSRLCYLPIVETELTDTDLDITFVDGGNPELEKYKAPPCAPDSEILIATDNNYSNIEILFSDEDDQGVCINKIEIICLWGKCTYDTEKGSDVMYYSRPGCNISYDSILEEKILLDNFSSKDPSQESMAVVASNSMEEATITRKYDVYPKYMIEDRVLKLYLGFSAEFGQGIIVKSIKIYTVEYTKCSENIYVWERKYQPSTFINPGEGVNLDGPTAVLKPRAKGGPNFPMYLFADGIESMNKMRGEWADIYYGTFNRDPVSISIDNLTFVEEKEQRKLYEGAYDLEKVGEMQYFSFYEPPVVSYVLSGMKEEGDYGYSKPSVDCFSFKLEWENHGLAQSLLQWPHWHPGGHRWAWSEGYWETKCMLFDVPHKTYQAKFIHVYHGGAITALEPDDALYTGRMHYQNAILRQFMNSPSAQRSVDINLVTRAVVDYGVGKRGFNPFLE